MACAFSQSLLEVWVYLTRTTHTNQLMAEEHVLLGHFYATTYYRCMMDHSGPVSGGHIQSNTGVQNVVSCPDLGDVSPDTILKSWFKTS